MNVVGLQFFSPYTTTTPPLLLPSYYCHTTTATFPTTTTATTTTTTTTTTTATATAATSMYTAEGRKLVALTAARMDAGHSRRDSNDKHEERCILHHLEILKTLPQQQRKQQKTPHFFSIASNPG